MRNQKQPVAVGRLHKRNELVMITAWSMIKVNLRLSGAIGILFMLAALLIGGCVAPIEAPSGEATEAPMEEPAAAADAPVVVASITLPDGTECLNAGQGATMAFDEQRVNYTCASTDEGDVVLLGDLVSPMLDLLTVNQGLVVRGDEGFDLAESMEITMRMSEVTLADEMVCLNAGQGATLGFDGKRVNYTCETGDEGDVVLLGDFQADMTSLTVERGLIVQDDEGFDLAESELVAVIAVVGTEAE